MLLVPLLVIILTADGGISPRSQVTSTDWCRPILYPGMENGGELRLHLEPGGTWTRLHVPATRPPTTGDEDAADDGGAPRAMPSDGQWRFEGGLIVLRPHQGSPLKAKWLADPTPACATAKGVTCDTSRPIGDVLLVDNDPIPYVRCVKP